MNWCLPLSVLMVCATYAFIKYLEKQDFSENKYGIIESKVALLEQELRVIGALRTEMALLRAKASDDRSKLDALTLRAGFKL